MMVLLLRVLPFLIGMMHVGAFWFQRRYPNWYPLPAALALGVFLIVVAIFSWKRIAWRDVLEKVLPTGLAECGLVLALLFVESDLARAVVSILAGIVSFVVLELLFLLAYEPRAYPVNGLTRWNLALVPLIGWYLASVSIGMRIFLHAPTWIHPVILGLAFLILFRTTGQPGAAQRENRVWMFVGTLAGLQLGWIELILPLGVEMQGALAALLLSCLIRLRRYGFAPAIPRTVSIIEGVGVTVFLIAMLVTATWT